MNIYLAVKYVHVVCALLSISGFVVRGVWMMTGNPLLARRPVKILPHLVDTLLLASALLMVWMSAQYPFVQSWLTAKVIALVLYILLGTVALKRGTTRGIRITAWWLALLVFAYIVSVALSRSALGFLALI
jgi:uncharacterized membrane protein SirB2